MPGDLPEMTEPMRIKTQNPAISEGNTGYYTPHLQLLIRLALPAVVIFYGYAQNWDLLLFPVSVALALCALYFFWHLIIHLLTVRYGLSRQLLIAAYAADVIGGHLAWLGDPYDPAPLFLNILFGAFGNGLQHGLYTYRYLCFFNLIATIIVYSIRTGLLGFSFYSFIMVFLGYCLLGYAYRMIQKNDHYKNQIKKNNDRLMEEVRERRRIEKALLENEAELKEYRDHLEQMVTERTEELSRMNSQLQKEIENRILVEMRNRESRKNEKLYQEQLFHAAKMTSLGTLVAGVAHEINNPVSAIMLNAPVLKKIAGATIQIFDEQGGIGDEVRIGAMRYADLKERLPLLIDSISEGAERIKSIIDGLKDYSRESSLEMTDAVDLNLVCEKAVKLVQNLISKSTDSFTESYEKNMPRFRGNHVRIEQVVINLLINACQALETVESGIKLATHHDAAANRVRVIIKDEGTGISREVLSRIRDPFFTTKRDSGGTGLGLSISDRIVREHKGTIEFSSANGNGTEVAVAFPVKPTENGGVNE